MAAAEGAVWVLLDDRAGNRSQALGVAERLGVPFITKEITYGPFIRLPNAVLGASLIGLDAGSKLALSAPWPTVVVAAGRRTSPVARWIKRQNIATKLVQIMDPGAGHGDFDLICRPAHDEGPASANVLEIAAAPHRFSAAKLAEARSEWESRLASFEKPRIAAFIGGSTRRRTFSSEMARNLCEKLNTVATSLGGSVLATTSRRTGPQVSVFAENLTAPHELYRWDQEGGENPYEGYLASADVIVVTGESVSMCSEAVATGKPFYIFAPDGLITAKHARLHANLIDGGHARILDGAIDPDWTPASLDVSSGIVAEIQKRGILEAS